MRNQPSARPFCRLRHLALVASMLVIVTPIVGITDHVEAATVTPWTADGPGNFTLDSDGSVTSPKMSYNLFDTPLDPLGPPRFRDQTWTLSTTARTR